MIVFSFFYTFIAQDFEGIARRAPTKHTGSSRRFSTRNAEGSATLASTSGMQHELLFRNSSMHIGSR